MVNINEQDEADFTSCRLNDLPRDFAWGVATAAY
jgi:beta-glucosidase